MSEIKIETIEYVRNPMHDAVANNDPLEDKLHVISVISSVNSDEQHYQLMHEFIKRMEFEESDVELYIVELVCGTRDFQITNEDNKHHLQIRTETPLWYKENLINIAVDKLLPKTAKCFAFIDPDIEFESTTWVQDTLKILNGSRDVVQLYSHCDDLNSDKLANRTFSSFGYHYTKRNKYSDTGPNYWNPGHAWALTRKFYNKMNGLYDLNILGFNCQVFSLSFIKNVLNSANEEFTQGYLDSILSFQEKTKGIRLGYVPGVIRHYYSDTKVNPNIFRWELLIKHKYNPKIHMSKNDIGLLTPTNLFPQDLLLNIAKYYSYPEYDL